MDKLGEYDLEDKWKQGTFIQKDNDWQPEYHVFTKNRSLIEKYLIPTEEKNGI